MVFSKSCQCPDDAWVSVAGCGPTAIADNDYATIDDYPTIPNGWEIPADGNPFDVGYGDGVRECASGWTGYKYNNLYGTLRTTLTGAGTATIIYGDCYGDGYVGLYQNGVEIDRTAVNARQGFESWTMTEKTTTFQFSNGDQIELQDNGGCMGGCDYLAGAAVWLGQVTLTCPRWKLRHTFRTLPSAGATDFGFGGSGRKLDFFIYVIFIPRTLAGPNCTGAIACVHVRASRAFSHCNFYVLTSGATPEQTPETAAYVSACSAHAGCAHLGGDCCPTLTGMMLGCCDEMCRGRLARCDSLKAGQYFHTQ